MRRTVSYDRILSLLQGGDEDSVNLKATLGLEDGAGNATTNATLLQAALTSDAASLPYQVGGLFRIGNTINVDRTAHRFNGTGLHRSTAASTVGALYGTPSGFISHLPLVSFNGTSVTASTSGASDTITITGHTVTSSDVGLTLRVTGGTNYTTGTYVVGSVSTSSNSWTLDRTCSTGNGSGLTGSAGGILFKDRCHGSVYDGLFFSGLPLASNSRLVNTAPRASALLQFTTTFNTVNPAKCHVQNCMFTDADVGILMGTGMVKAWEIASSYTGSTDNHGDTLTATNCFFHGIKTGIYLRTEQSVSHSLRHIQAINFEDLVYVERGGELTLSDVMVGGSIGSLIRIGKCDSNNGRITLENFGFDANSSSTNMKILKMDDISNNVFGRVTIRDGLIDSGIGTYPTPIIEARSGWRVHVQNVERLIPGSILCDPGTDSYRPYVLVENCYLAGLTSDNNRDEQAELIHEDSGANYVVKFRNCSNYRNSTIYEDLDVVDGELVDPHA